VSISRAVHRSGRTALAALLALGPVLSVRAAEATSPTLWGVVPDAVRSRASQVVNETVGGGRVGTLPASTDGRFEFANLAVGDYVVRVVDSTGQTVAQSHVARVQPATATEARFDDQLGPAAVFPAGGGSSKALVIVGAAALVGVGTAIVLASGDDPSPASPSR
jgi:hypothetical protein